MNRSKNKEVRSMGGDKGSKNKGVGGGGMGEKIKSFQDLVAWQEAHGLVLEIYRVTETFPRTESFGLTSQIRRAAVSVTSCIAEGFSRNTFKDKYNFYRMSQGSLTELQSQLIIARDLGYISKDVYQLVFNKSIVVHKLLTGLCKSTALNFNP